MKFIMGVSAGQFEWNEHDTAYVEIDEEFLAQIAKRKEAWELVRETDSSLYCLRYWCGDVDFFEGADDVCSSESMRHDDFEEPAEERILRIDCLQMVVTQDGIYWTCYPKHGDYRLETARIDWEELGL